MPTPAPSFHLPLKETKLTLDDMTSLIDIFITDAFYNFEHMGKEMTILLFVDL